MDSILPHQIYGIKVSKYKIYKAPKSKKESGRVETNKVRDPMRVHSAASGLLADFERRIEAKNGRE